MTHPENETPVVGSVPSQEIPIRRRSKRNSMVLHTRPGSLMGSLGRQSFADYIRPSPSQVKVLVDAECPGSADVIEDGDGALLDSGIGAPTETERLLHEREELLRDNGISVPESRYGSTSRSESTPATGRSTSTELPQSEAEAIETAWDEAIASGSIATSYRREAIVLISNSIPLAITFFFQYSLVVASVFSVGHLGKVELGAVSLASMTAGVTGFALIQGLATCLDTLCPQSFGAGRPDLVGVYFQKCVALILCCLIPVVLIWYNAATILPWVLPSGEDELIEFAARYLRVMILGIPGYTLFESGKRFLQAQGIFHAATMVIAVCAPLNVLLNYTLVWNKHFGIGFIGAPLAVAITNTLMAILLGLYVVFVDGKKCWNGLSMDVFKGWGTLIKLAIPGVIMVESEFFAFEFLTFASSRFGTSTLAAQTILSSLTSLAYEMPFALSVAASTRVANFVGAGLITPAIISIKVSCVLAFCLSTVDSFILYTFRYQIANLFSNDQDVIDLAAHVFVWVAFLHIFDGGCCVLGGILRGQGRQHIGGIINLMAYYAIGVPAALLFAFVFNMELSGLWLGLTVGLLFAVVASFWALRVTDWKSVVAAARKATNV